MRKRRGSRVDRAIEAHTLPLLNYYTSDVTVNVTSAVHTCTSYTYTLPLHTSCCKRCGVQVQGVRLCAVCVSCVRESMPRKCRAYTFRQSTSRDTAAGRRERN
eukprot:scaffold6283_cov127-Isochrysis_galbana.AAC.5